MSNNGLIVKRPTRASFKGGRAVHDIFDNQGVKWIARGQLLSEKQIDVALEKGSLTRRTFEAQSLTAKAASPFDVKPTFGDLMELTNSIEQCDQEKKTDLAHNGLLSKKTEGLITQASDSMMDLLSSNQFSPYKLTGLTSFLYNEPSFKTKRPQLKTLNNSGTQYTLFKDVMTDNLNGLVIANLLNPYALINTFVDKNASAQHTRQQYLLLCQQASDTLQKSIKETKFNTGFIVDLLRYFSPHLYFTSPEMRLFQQINEYVNFLMPEPISEKLDFPLSDIPVINLANFFKQPQLGGGLGVEGSRIVQYVGLLPSGTAIQFSNREKGLIIAPKIKDILYCVVITGMDGQPLITPSLREISFRDLNKTYVVIPSHDLPLKYEDHAHEKIWKMHIVHENLKRSADA